MLRSLGEQLRLIGIDPAGLNAESISRSAALRSPIHGWVSKVNVNIGRYVQPTDVLFELVDPKDIHLALTVFEKDLGRCGWARKSTRAPPRTPMKNTRPK
ncbi:MAG: efflux RND transporter periplasmic adaptor subunit [Flavobacteriales bacterium]|nr:efflux RND transporter periplasmic adaptor subunit [Flavobacteriales bacterium]